MSHPAAWLPDPLGRYELRWWDGAAWTDNVSRGGQTAIDPVVAPPPPVVEPIGPVEGDVPASLVAALYVEGVPPDPAYDAEWSPCAGGPVVRRVDVVIAAWGAALGSLVRDGAITVEDKDSLVARVRDDASVRLARPPVPMASIEGRILGVLAADPDVGLRGLVRKATSAMTVATAESRTAELLETELKRRGLWYEGGPDLAPVAAIQALWPRAEQVRRSLPPAEIEAVLKAALTPKQNAAGDGDWGDMGDWD